MWRIDYEREHGLADFVVLLAVVGVAMVIWAVGVESTAALRGRLLPDLSPAVLFALAALTRDARWAMIFRLLTGGWILAAPYLLGLWQAEPAIRASQALGALVLLAGISELVGRTRARTLLRG